MFRSTLMVSALAALGTAVSFLNQLILARLFGTSAQMDAYLIAISLPFTISGLLAGVLNYQLVPALRRADQDHGGTDALIRSLTWGLGGGTLVLALVGAGESSDLIRFLNPSLPGSEQAMIAKLAHITWLCLPIAVICTIYTAGLHIRKQFAAATMLSSMPMAGSIIACTLAHTEFGIQTAAWGQFIGYLAMLAGLRLTQGRQGEGGNWGGMRKILAEMPLALAAVLIFVLYPFSDSIWGSRVGLSAVSYLGYAQRLLVGFSGLAVVGATTVIFPRLAHLSAEGDDQTLRRELGLSIRIMLVCMAPAAAVIAALSVPAVQLLFQRGAFRSEDAAALGGLLRPMLLGMVAMSCMGLVFKALFARGQLRAAAVLSLVGSGTYFGLSGLFCAWFGVLGVGYAYAISWWLLFVLGIRHLWRGIPQQPLIAFGSRFAIRLASATALVSVTAWIGSQFLPAAVLADFSGRFSVVSGTSVAATCVYILFGYSPFAPPEVRFLVRRVLAFVKRP